MIRSCELETDKVNVEINSDYTGVIVELLAEEGDDVAVGQAIARVDESGEAGETVESAPEAAKEEPKAEAKQEVQDDKQEEAAPAAASLDVIATPAARKLAREKGIDLASVQASDPLGRIRPQDVEAASQRPKQPAPQAPAQQRQVRHRKNHIAVSGCPVVVKRSPSVWSKRSIRQPC